MQFVQPDPGDLEAASSSEQRRKTTKNLDPEAALLVVAPL